MAKKLTSTKARKILHDKEVHGHPLTEQQRKFFGAIAGGAKPYKAQAGVKTCPPGFVNIEGKCFDRASDAYKALYKYGIGYMDDTDTLVSSRMELPEVVLKPKSVLDFLDKIDLSADAKFADAADRYAFDQLGKKYGFIPNIKILKENQPSYLKQKLFEVFDPSRTKRNLGKTAHYNPFSKTAYVDNIEDYIAELSHHVDPFILEPGKILMNDLPAFIKQKNEYETKGTREYTAHQEIQPKLEKDYKKYEDEYWDNVFRVPYYDETDPLRRKQSMGYIWNDYVSPVKKKKDGGWLDKYDEGGVLKQKKEDNYGVQGNYNNYDISLPDGFKGWAYNLKGRNYSPAWGGQFAMGGNLPGATGMMYARTINPAPSNGPYAKKTKASAQDGKKLSYSAWKKKHNLKETEDYNLKRAWELGYAPDKTGHLPTVDNQTGEFLKAKGHPTLQLELDWYNSPEAADFRSKNAIDSSGKFFKYVPKSQDGKNFKDDSNLENLIEIVDPTGITSWDDIYRSYKKSGFSPETALEIFGALPLLGKVGKVGKVTEAAGKAFAITGRQKRNVRAVAETLKVIGKYGPSAGRATDTYQAYDQWQNGGEMKFYQAGLDFKPKTISQDGSDIPVDPMGYWNPENVGEPVIIPSNEITMEGVDQPLIGISDTGDVQYMMPGEDYEFDGEYVTEYPVAKKGISVNNADAQPLKKLDQLFNFTNYNKPTKGGWLDKYN